MQHIKRPPIRNKINMADPAQVRTWTRRLRLPADELKAVVEKVGNSIVAVTKEVELQAVKSPAKSSNGLASAGRFHSLGQARN